MRRTFLSLSTLTVAFFFFTGCNDLMLLVNDLFPADVTGNESAGTEVIVTSGNPVLDSVYTNVEAANTEDLELYMATIHPDSIYYDSTRTSMINLFATYDLNYNLTEIEVIEMTDTEARVRFTLETTKISGPDFNDNIISGVFILRLDGDTWKIYDQTIDNVEYIND